MKKLLSIVAIIFLISNMSYSQNWPKEKGTYALFETSKGNILIKLFSEFY